MDKQKQIEEMANVIESIKLYGTDNYERKISRDSVLELAEELIKYYQPKIPECAVVVSKQVWDEHIENWDKTTKAVEERVRKETAEKFAERLKERLDISVNGYSTSEVMSEIEDKIDEIEKEITEGV